jgi:hypothetical protein
MRTKSDSSEHVIAFAALRDDGTLTIVLINKHIERTAEVQLQVEGRTSRSELGTLFRLTNPPGPIRKEALPADAKTITLPPMSAVMVVRP